MGKRRRKYKRRSEPGWYKDQKGKRYAARVTVLSLVAMLLLVIAVPVIFWAGGGYDAMAGDSLIWRADKELDFEQVSAAFSWGVDADMGRLHQSDAEAMGIDAPVAWFYPDEQNETYSSLVIDCPVTECSSTDGGVLAYVTFLNVTPAWMLDKSVDMLKVKVRLSVSTTWHLEFQAYDGNDIGTWLDDDTMGVLPNFFGATAAPGYNVTADVWKTVNYRFTRTGVLQAADGLGTGSRDRVAIGVNITNASLAPKDYDGEVLDFEFAFYSSGGGIKMAGELFGWSVGMMLMLCAAASTPYWNPTREKGERKYRKSRRWYR